MKKAIGMADKPIRARIATRSAGAAKPMRPASVPLGTSRIRAGSTRLALGRLRDLRGERIEARHEDIPDIHAELRGDFALAALVLARERDADLAHARRDLAHERGLVRGTNAHDRGLEFGGEV